VRLRHAVAADAAAFESFDIGPLDSAWLREVAQIVDGLLEWRDDPSCARLRREVVIAEESGHVVGVCAHELLRAPDGRIYEDHRYLMVTAVSNTAQRSGIARQLVETVLQLLADGGARSVEWLVHPANGPSIAFSRRSFPDADETYPPDDTPYVRFALSLA
jgi:GNAT superfamily N-acetyltransferase